MGFKYEIESPVEKLLLAYWVDCPFVGTAMQVDIYILNRSPNWNDLSREPAVRLLYVDPYPVT